MARFVFKLRPVLEQRERTEREHQKRVAELERERLALEQVIRTHQRSIVQERRDLRDLVGDPEISGPTPVELSMVRVQANASLFLVGKAQRAALELAGVHKRLQAARAELLEATTARRALEQLRDRQHEAWLKEENRKEASALDEIGVIAAARRLRSDSPEERAA